jgi:Xaa-Pro dipeptidase
VASILADRKAKAGHIGIEETLPFVFADGIAKAALAARIESATAVTAGCRMIKDAHELELLRRSNEITVAAHRAVFASLHEGITQARASALSPEAHRRLGVNGGSLVLFGPDAAFPHGTTRPTPLKAGDLVLIDGGGKLHDYSSDITRTAVFGGAPPTQRQRTIWDLVRRAREASFRAARPGVECQAVDMAARRVIEEGGFGPDYRYFTHRVGHCIGMDGHEWTYLVRGNTTRQPGMCFSDEPGIYIPGELGVRHEDIIFITENGAENMTKWSGTPEEPAVI